MKFRFASLLTIAAGFLSAAAFDPYSVPFAMIIALALLIWLLRSLSEASQRTIAFLGFLYGLSFMAPLIWWMNAVSHGGYVGLVLAEAVLFAPICLALWAVLRLPGWPLWGAAIWVTGEYVRGTFPLSGFPWGRLAHSAIDTPFQAYARYVGMPATSALLFLIATLLVGFFTASTWRVRGTTAAVIVAVSLLGGILPTKLAGGQGERRVAVIQGNVPGVFLTWPRGEILDLHLAETQRLADRVRAGTAPRPDVVLWPENATDIDPFHDEPTRTKIEALSKAIGAPIVVGGLFDGPTNETAYNAGVVWTENGPGDRYVKRKLVPYGEYVPFRNVFGNLVPRLDRDIPRDMLPGKEPGDLRVGDFVIGDTICWDIAYDEVVRQTVDSGANFLVVQTSNASFTGTSQPEQQWDISRLRAIETGRWVAVPSTNGISGIVAPDGSVVERAPEHQPATVEADIGLATARTPGLILSAPLEWLGIVVGLIGLALAVSRRRSL